MPGNGTVHGIQQDRDVPDVFIENDDAKNSGKRTFLLVGVAVARQPDEWFIYDDIDELGFPCGDKIAQGRTLFNEDPAAYHDLVTQHGITDVIVEDAEGFFRLTPEQWESEGFWLQEIDRR